MAYVNGNFKMLKKNFLNANDILLLQMKVYYSRSL